MSVKFYENFEKALLKLREFANEPIVNDRDRAGLIQGFEFTFEQCWKAIQKASTAEGINIASPKSAFSWAMEKGWISEADEKIWLDMLADRNLTSHTYRDAIANSVVANIKTNYVAAFEKLIKKWR